MMMVSIINWWRRFTGVEYNYELISTLRRDISLLHNELHKTREAFESQSHLVDEAMKDMHKNSVMDVDGSYRGPSTIILTGVYRGRGYVKFYDVDVDDFRHFVEMFRHQERHTLLRVTDLPHYYHGGSFQI